MNKALETAVLSPVSMQRSDPILKYLFVPRYTSKEPPQN